jgi:hypothetical protein
VLNSPVQYLYNIFRTFQGQSIQEANKNGQAIVLQRALSQYVNVNGGFGPVHIDDVVQIIYPSNNIFIEDYPFNIVLPATVKLNEKLISSDILQVGLVEEESAIQCALIEETESEFDFQVRIADFLLLDKTQKTVRSIVDRYKVAGRKYVVVTFPGEHEYLPL